jgi:hypothetical protein
MPFYTVKYETAHYNLYHTFAVNLMSVKFGGWARAQLMTIKREYTDGKIQKEQYNASVHTFNTGHEMSRPYTSRLTKVRGEIKIYWTDGVRHAYRDMDYEKNSLPSTSPNAHLPVKEPDDEYIYSSCKTCKMRVGAHSTQESRICGLM